MRQNFHFTKLISPSLPPPSHRKQAQLRLQQKCESLREECQSLLERMNGLLAGCSQRHLLPGAALQAYQTGCQRLLTVLPRLEQSQSLDEEQVYVHAAIFFKSQKDASSSEPQGIYLSCLSEL